MSLAMQLRQAAENIRRLADENMEIKLALAESEEARLQTELDVKLALAELAEVVNDG